MKTEIEIDNYKIGILPCPFCGKTGRLNNSVFNGATHSFIQCEGCGATTKKVMISTQYSSELKVVELWNKRVKD